MNFDSGVVKGCKKTEPHYRVPNGCSIATSLCYPFGALMVCGDQQNINTLYQLASLRVPVYIILCHATVPCIFFEAIHFVVYGFLFIVGYTVYIAMHSIKATDIG